jgi:hypothetical protein
MQLQKVKSKSNLGRYLVFGGISKATDEKSRSWIQIWIRNPADPSQNVTDPKLYSWDEKSALSDLIVTAKL